HLAMLLVLPPLGFAAAALWAVAPRPGPLLALLAPALAGPLALADPEEVTLVLFGRDVPFWVAVAAGASLALALLVGLAYALLVAPRPGPAGRRRTGLLTAAAVAVAATAVYAWPGQPGLHGDRLFVVLRAQADLSAVPADAPPGQAGRDTRVRAVHGLLVAHAERTQAPLRRELDRLRLSYTPYYLVNAVEVAGGPAVRAWLGRRADVDRILPSQRVRPLPAHPGPERGSVPTPAAPPWNITQIGADRVWSEFGIRGAGITVGTSDSGVDGAHPALAGGYRGGDDSWYDPWAGTTTPRDRGGHGTHTLGSAVGAGGIGVAPDAQWVGCVNLDRNLGSPARYLDCLQFMLAPFPRGGDPFADGRPERAPHVLTNSWGCPAVEGCDTSVLGPATAAFAAAGVFFVAAAGNTGPECGSVDDPPAVYPDVLSVGAVDRAGQVVDFSSRGPTPAGAVKPDVAAPGAGILSALPGGGYGELSGTSMAAPHVAGVVALLWSARPALIGDVAKTREVLQTFKTATGTGEALCGKGNTVGTGVVDAYAVVAATRRDG
ncbi:MAG TPA: S8 family serine peptidase, partial [Pilimelia sp.]|nr:S8 family serine peptidase [Pilimelia sp.]